MKPSFPAMVPFLLNLNHCVSCSLAPIVSLQNVSSPQKVALETETWGISPHLLSSTPVPTATVPCLIDLPTRLSNWIPLIGMDPRTVQIHTRETIPALPIGASVVSGATDITLGLPIAKTVDLEAAGADWTSSCEHGFCSLTFGTRRKQIASEWWWRCQTMVSSHGGGARRGHRGALFILDVRGVAPGTKRSISKTKRSTGLVTLSTTWCRDLADAKSMFQRCILAAQARNLLLISKRSKFPQTNPR